jgi:hypothetical protein
MKSRSSLAEPMISVYERSGQEIGRPPAGANWLQYQAVFSSPNGCRSPRRREVTINLLTNGEGHEI